MFSVIAILDDPDCQLAKSEWPEWATIVVFSCFAELRIGQIPKDYDNDTHRGENAEQVDEPDR